MDVPDGYRRYGKQGLVLIDPTDCPGCGRFRFGQRKAPTLCGVHRDGHLSWICACGQWIYRVPGAYVGELNCATR